MRQQRESVIDDDDSIILNFLFLLGSIIIDINIAYTIVWIFIFPIHLKSLV